MGGLPIRLRLTIWYSSILMVALGATGAGAWVAARHSLLASIDLLLRDRSMEIGNVLRQVGSEGKFDESRSPKARSRSMPRMPLVQACSR